MVILPAIDLIGGTPVRLYKGDFDTASKVADNAAKTAQSFESQGAKWLHVVDLDGAKAGRPVNCATILSIAQNTNLNIEVGGGIRDIKTIEFYLQNGVKRVILGSCAVKNPELVKKAVSLYPEHIAVGIDARDGMVSCEGWLDNSEINYIELAKSMEQIGVKYIIFTDISRDGTLNGPNIEQLKDINEAVSCKIIASGGIRDINDIVKLKNAGMYGAICGKSIYSGTLSLSEAIKVGGQNG